MTRRRLAATLLLTGMLVGGLLYRTALLDLVQALDFAVP